MSPAAGQCSITLFGLNYRTAPVEVREKMAFSPKRLVKGLTLLRSEYEVEEAVILSTCNRVEIYALLPEGGDPQSLGRFLCSLHERTLADIEGMTYVRRGRDAVHHLFRVASGLDSQVVGESQILGQVREAYMRAKGEGSTGRTLNLLFQKALKVGKDVRTRTEIGSSGASVASVAIGFMRKIYEDLSTKRIFIIGSGAMGKLTMAQLAREGAQGLCIVNRSQERARELAERFGGEVVPYSNLRGRLHEADIVISSTAAPHAIIREEQVRQAMRMRRGAPQVIMDIAIPRDVAPAVAKIPNVYLYNVDDLDRVIRDNLDGRGEVIARGEEIVVGQVEAYFSMEARLDLGPVITRMREGIRGIIKEELDRSLGNGHSMDQLVDRLTGKILHGPIQALHHRNEEGTAGDVADLVEHLFDNGGARPPDGEGSR